ncbi:MAG: FtsX-like permease family protein [Promethearchaeota archaeon]
MNITFALKDFYRGRKSNFPYLLIITLIIAFSIFLIYFTHNTGLDSLVQGTSQNTLFFSGSLRFIYSEFNTLILFMVIILAVVMISIILMSFIIFKKRDIAIMRAIGTLPGNLHGFYLLEVIFIFLIGFTLGLFFGLISYGIYSLISSFLGLTIYFQIEIFYSLILFLSCLAASIIVPGFILMKLGNQNIIKSFSKDIPYNYDASRGIKFIPKYISRFSFNIKIAVSNTIRRKGDFKRYLLIFSIIYSIIFTICLGTFVLSNSSQSWISASQGEDIVAIGHKDTLLYYSLMYGMFSNPNLIVDEDDINFLNSNYLFNFSDINDINNLTEVEKIDERLIHFGKVEEDKGTIVSEYREVGQNRSGTFPIIGINSSQIIQQFVMEGEFFTDDGSTASIVVGDGLAFNFFDSVFDQGIIFKNYSYSPRVSGYVIDSFYNGFSIYVRLDILQNKLNLTSEINLALLKIESGSFNNIKNELNNIITNSLGYNFTCILLDGVFNVNLSYLHTISFYPLYLIIILAIIGTLSFYNYQKGGLFEKAKDFLVMKALGTKKTSIKRIIFSEGLFVILPSLVFSLSIGMILNSFFLFDKVFLPPLSVPLIIVTLLGFSAIILNYLSMIPLIKKLNKFSIKDFEIY